MPPPFCHNPEIDAVNRKSETTKARGRNRRAFGDLVRLVPVHDHSLCLSTITLRPAEALFVPLPTPLALCDSGIALPERLAREAACGAGFDGAGEIPENGVGVKVSPITTLPLPIVTPPHETSLPVTAAGIPLMSTVAEPAAMARGWGGCLGLECGARGSPTRATTQLSCSFLCAFFP